MAKSASAIMVGPEIVPPGRMNCGVIGLAHAAAAVPDLLDRQAAVGVEHLRKFGAQEAAPARLTRHRFGCRHASSPPPCLALALAA